MNEFLAVSLQIIRTYKRVLAPEAAPLTLALGVWLGAGAFIGWQSNPPLAWGVAAMGVALLGLTLPKLRLLAWALLAIGTGWALAYGSVARQEARAFPWAVAAARSHTVVGQVAEIRAQPTDPRRATLTLRPVHWFGLPTEAERPPEVRVGVWASQLAGVAMGGTVAIPLKIISPEAPAIPNMRDGRLWAWYGPARVNAFASGPLEPTADGQRYLAISASYDQQIIAEVEGGRRQIIAATRTLGQGVPTALLVGEQRFITPAVRDAYRATGLGHLLAISGMQMTLVGLGVFWLLRYMGAAIPTLALRVNLKLWAACGALLVVGGYTLLVGAGPSIIRAATMVALVLVAVLLGRVRGVLRAWALACGAIVATSPELALSAGLQLSAVATLALGVWAQTEAAPRGVLGWARGLLLATVVAGAATAPVAVLHFGTQPALGLLANMVAIPLMTVASYAGFAALALWPLGLQNLALAPLEWLVALTTYWAAWVQQLQENANGFYLAPMGWEGALLLALAALLTLGLAMIKHWWALAAVTLTSMAALWAWNAYAPPPQLIMAQRGEAAWRRFESGQYRLLWAENTGDAARWARQGRIDLSPEVPKNVACCADEMILPKSHHSLAYAQKWNGAWQVVPLGCARPWQRVAEVCAGFVAVKPEDAQ